MANSQHEPTMEEILASIRKIIAEDPPGSESVASSSPDTSEEPEVLNLTQEVHVETGAVTSGAQPAADDRPETASDEATKTNGTIPSPPHLGEGIFSEKTRQALSDAFAGLEPASTQTGNEQVPSMIGLPIEAVFEKAVREAFDPVLRKWLDDNAATLIERMKPVISEWLDKHFPAMLEDAVRNEVARAVMARGRH
jgi:cell pole-organizing protein PopZ